MIEQRVSYAMGLTFLAIPVRTLTESLGCSRTNEEAPGGTSGLGSDAVASPCGDKHS